MIVITKEDLEVRVTNLFDYGDFYTLDELEEHLKEIFNFIIKNKEQLLEMYHHISRLNKSFDEAEFVVSL
jgi:hypothetical protein